MEWLPPKKKDDNPLNNIHRNLEEKRRENKDYYLATHLNYIT